MTWIPSFGGHTNGLTLHLTVAAAAAASLLPICVCCVAPLTASSEPSGHEEMKLYNHTLQTS